MDISGDRITCFTSSYHKFHYFYECLPCRFQTNGQATFLNHKVTKNCVRYHGDWFLKCKKLGMKNYHHIVHKYIWQKIMMNIRK